jgi:hypothetical protein
MSVGYATIYGDMNGGYNPLKDAYKTTVFAISEWRNRARLKIGLGPTAGRLERILTAAERGTAPGSEGSGSLPDYPVLDAILTDLVEQERSVDQIVAEGYDRATVERIERLLHIAEYKRRGTSGREAGHAQRPRPPLSDHPRVPHGLNRGLNRRIGRHLLLRMIRIDGRTKRPVEPFSIRRSPMQHPRPHSPHDPFSRRDRDRPGDYRRAIPSRRHPRALARQPRDGHGHAGPRFSAMPGAIRFQTLPAAIAMPKRPAPSTARAHGFALLARTLHSQSPLLPRAHAR